MAGKESTRGATADTVTTNITRIRESQNLNYTQVSDRLKAYGRPISAVGVRRIETGERRVDVDDLVGLAAALGVSPSTLLMPSRVDAGQLINIANTEMVAAALWEWLIAEWPFPGRGGLAEFFTRALPPWKLAVVERRIAERHGETSIADVERPITLRFHEADSVGDDQ